MNEKPAKSDENRKLVLVDRICFCFTIFTFCGYIIGFSDIFGRKFLLPFVENTPHGKILPLFFLPLYSSTEDTSLSPGTG